MKIGDIVMVSGRMIQSTTYGGAKIVFHTRITPRRAMYLGKSIIYEGTVVYGFDEPNHFEPSARHSVLVFQPLQNSGERYLKPFYALADDIASENAPTHK